jgi:hypothetical protein
MDRWHLPLRGDLCRTRLRANGFTCAHWCRTTYPRACVLDDAPRVDGRSCPLHPGHASGVAADYISHWRTERRIYIGYDGSRFALPELQWAQHSFMQPQMMVQDRYFYDPVAGKYTVDRYLDDLEKRYGGIDAVLDLASVSEHGHRRSQPA